MKCNICEYKLYGEQIYWGEKCQGCMACVQCCPKKAIYFNEKTKNRIRYKNPNISTEELFYW